MGQLDIRHCAVRQGLGVLITLENEGETVFVGILDMGSIRGFISDVSLDKIIDSINEHGGVLDYVLISHPHTDHYNLFKKIGSKYKEHHRKEITISKIVLGFTSPSIKTIFPDNYFVYDKVVYIKENYLFNGEDQCKHDVRLDLPGADFTITILTGNNKDKKNEESCVALVSIFLKGKDRRHSYLFTGDIPSYLLREKISQRLGNLFFLIPHHGSSDSNKVCDLEEILKRNNILVVFVSGDPTSQYNHPRTNIIKFFEENIQKVTSRHVVSSWDNKEGYTNHTTTKDIRGTVKLDNGFNYLTDSSSGVRIHF